MLSMATLESLHSILQQLDDKLDLIDNNLLNQFNELEKYFNEQLDSLQQQVNSNKDNNEILHSMKTETDQLSNQQKELEEKVAKAVIMLHAKSINH
jgi:uncharacterized phage infection (PIP) family protein YhgE